MNALKGIINWFKEQWIKLMNWWNEMVSDEEIAKIIEEYEGKEAPAHLFFKNPIRQWWEKTKIMIDKAVGKGGAFTLIGCTAVLGFLLISGGSSIWAVTGIGIATVYGAILAINRFPKLEKFVTKYYKIIDLAMFALGFYMANSIFGFQVAAVGGILVSIALILWKVYTDSKVREGIKDEMRKANEFKDAILDTVLNQEPAIAAC